MSDHFGIPGIGGSLGQCAICGENFLLVILTDAKVVPLKFNTIKQTCYAHKACIDNLPDPNNIDVEALPTKSPVRQAYEAQKQQPSHTHEQTD